MKLEDALKTTRFESMQHKAILNVIYTAYWYKSQMQTVMKGFKLTGEQFNVLRILRGKHPAAMCVKDIASRMIEESSNVPRIIDRLILKELVQRTQSPADRRETLISLTEKGISELDAASIAMKNFTGQLIDLSEEEAQILHNALERLRNNQEK